MAGSEGSVGGQTELLSGWSCVVHRPSEDPEPSSLPSTVDITAFSSGPSVPPTHSLQDDCCSNSDSDSGSDSENSVSDASGSCSYSSSDSESSSSSQASSSSSVPAQFSVTSSQTGGLRLTIATVRKSCSSPGPQNDPEAPSASGVASAEENNSNNTVVKQLPATKLSSSDSDTDCSDSESTDSESQSQKSSEKKAAKRDSPGGRVKYLRKVSSKTMNKQNDKTDSGKKLVRKDQNSKVTKTAATRGRGRPPAKGNKMASLPLTRITSPTGNASSSDSESSVSESNSAMLASCSLQEIRQEDLAAILPDQQEPDCDEFGGFETGVHHVANVDDASESDMELPTQLVHAAIQRVTTGTESSSETDSQPATYASTLLQQFVQQTQLLNNPSSGSQTLGSTDIDSKATSTTLETSIKSSDSSKIDALKRKRGRPRKNISKKSASNSTIIPDSHNNMLSNEYCGEPNVSPDSGIQNSPDHLSSPESSPSPNVKSKTESVENKLKSISNDIQKNKSAAESIEPSAKVTVKSSSRTIKKGIVDQKVAQKQKMALTCNNLDRMLYANADRVLYPPRRKVGRPTSKVGLRKPGRPPKHRHENVQNVNNVAKSEPSITSVNKSKSINEKMSNTKATISSTEPVKKIKSSNKQHMSKNVQKTDTKQKNKKSNKASDNDIVQLTSNTLSLSLGKPDLKKSDISNTNNVNTVPKKMKPSGALLNEICERVSKRLELSNKNATVASNKTVLQSTASDENSSKSNSTTHKSNNKNSHKPKCIAFIKNKTKLSILKSKLTSFKHMKVMHTKHYQKHKKHKIKILKTVTSQSALSTNIDPDIDKLISDFVKYCNLGTNKSQKENLPEMFRCVKRLSKKRKGLENNEGRKKKKQTNTNSGESKETNSNEQRLPLKKRHYHISANNESKNSTTSSNTTIESKNNLNDDTTKQSADIKTKNGVINSNKSSVINAKNVPDKIKNPTLNNKEHTSTDQKMNSSPNKSPSHNISTNKSVLVMNKNQSNIVSKVTTNNNNVYMRKNADSEDLIGVHIDEAIEACITRYTSANSAKNTESEKVSIPEPKKSVTTITATTPKKRHRLETENVNGHKAQVENVTKKLDTTNAETLEKVPESIENVLENVVTELKNKKNINVTHSADNLNNNKKVDKKIETVAQMITRKKNRLEDLASNLVSKKSSVSSSEIIDKKLKKSDSEINSEQATRVSVIKSPIARRIKASDNDKLLDSIVDEKPTGIFLQTVDLELHIPATTIQTVQSNNQNEVPNKTEDTNQHNLRNKKAPEVSGVEITEKKTKPVKDIAQVDKQKGVESSVSQNVSDKSKLLVKKKVRRRKAINRTGFPTLKKKKKKIVTVPKICKTESETKEINVEGEKDNNIYDRIPRIGEEASTFVKRTQANCTLSVIALEKLQAKPESIISNTESDIVSKWEISSECDSLPMDECTFTSEFDSIKSIKSERPLSRLDIKQERMSLRLRDVSPATSVETRFSDRVKKRRELTPDTKSLEERVHYRTRDSSAGSEQTINEEFDRSIKRKRDSSSDKVEKKKKIVDDNHLNFKKRIRDLSPASSIEPLPSDKKQRSDSVASSSGDDTKRSKKATKWRKKFLVAGLFSDYYKEGDESVRARRESASAKARLMYNPNEHPYGLLPPPYHCGKYLRCRKVPFQLPHDLWWQHMHSQLPGRDLVPSWNYRKIRTNVYGSRNPSGACEPQACNCSTSSGCEDDCINRLVLAECPSTHRCRNQRIQKHEWAPGIEKFMTENKGWGVRTKMAIKSGEFILEYVGEVVSDQEFKHRMATRYAHDTHHYCLHLDGGLVIDGHRMGGDGRFVNHSCQPNCEMQKWSVNGQFRMALFALRDISSNEELTYDYNFSLFNPADGQVCKCGSNNCRGVIGGKSQRVRQLPSTIQSNNPETNNNQVGRVGRPRKNQAKKATANGVKEQPKEEKKGEPIPVIITPQVKPMSHQQKIFALQHHCFLLRNLEKVKRVRERMMPIPRSQNISTASSAFLSQLNALRQPRNMRTRRLAQAEDNPELNKAARLATVLRDLFELVTTAKDENNALLCTPFLTLPSKRKVPDYFQKISEPIDLNTIEQNIAKGVYRTVDAFDNDMIRLFVNSVRFFGRTSELGIAATRLRKVYGQGKADCLKRLEDVLGEKAPPCFVTGGKDPGDEEEDVIRCICGLYRDEGLMIQCERCLVWQHCECVRADPSSPTYHCERCVPRPVDLEIPLDEYTEHGHRYYISLMRGDLQLRQGDTVYVLRDIPIPGTDKKHTYETIGDVKYTDLDIFRIERLWKDKTNGQRFAFGHHYLRPHETYHEPTRKFFPNEVMRVPLYEVVPVELIMSVCWVLDINTYCKGRPVGSSEEHIYICEYRVDKTARLFSKISKSKYPVCTKTYAFERFDQRLKISRTYTPHEVQGVVKPRGRRPGEEREDRKEDVQQATAMPVIRVRTREEQRAHLNGILLHLLGRLPSKQALDVSYLLEGGRRRKKQQS